jgi:hypothetical protein
LRLPSVSHQAAAEADVVQLVEQDPVQAVLQTAAGRFSALPLVDGQEVEFVAAGDAARSLIFAAQYLEKNNGSFVTRANSIKCTLNDLVDQALERLNRMVPIEAGKQRTQLAPDTTRPLSALGFRPVMSEPGQVLENVWSGLGNHQSSQSQPIDPEPAPSDQRTEQVARAPISLSELLTGQYTPFLSRH